VNYGYALSLFAFSAFARRGGKSISRPMGTALPDRYPADAHVKAWERYQFHKEQKVRQEALLAEKRRRDAPWIDAAEAKRARKRAKNRQAP
jgi:hypothetical protein